MIDEKSYREKAKEILLNKIQEEIDIKKEKYDTMIINDQIVSILDGNKRIIKNYNIDVAELGYKERVFINGSCDTTEYNLELEKLSREISNLESIKKEIK